MKTAQLFTYNLAMGLSLSTTTITANSLATPCVGSAMKE
jgi:hypothetical protein